MKVLCLVLALGVPAIAVAQVPDGVPGAVSSAEATAFAEGWSALAQGDLATAAAVATRVLRDYPRQPAALALAVEVGVATGGWRGGLSMYEGWLAGRSVENFQALRRVARAVLFDALAQSPNLLLKVEAADVLSQDADPAVTAWVQQLADAQARAGQADVPTLAAAGDRRASAALAARLQADPRPVEALMALGRSGDPAAVAPIAAMLSSQRAEVRAAAATALGDLEAAQAMPQLRRLLQDPQVLPRMAAASSLARLGDSSGMSMLYDWFRSDVADVRLKAAEMSAFSPDASWQVNVRQLLQDPDPMVRIGAARLIGKHDPGAAQWVLQSLLNDQNLALRQEAQRALPESIGGDFAQLRRFLSAADDDTRVRAAMRIVELTR